MPRKVCVRVPLSETVLLERSSARKRCKYASLTQEREVPVALEGSPEHSSPDLDLEEVESQTSVTGEGDEEKLVFVLKKRSPKVKKEESASECKLIGDPISEKEARRRWPHRYNEKKSRKAPCSTPGSDDGAQAVYRAKHHYAKCVVDGVVFDLLDDAFVKGDENGPNFIGRIIEFFEGTDGEQYFTAQWFYRAQDTVIKDHAHLIDEKRFFLSEIKDENLLDCIVSKVNIVQVSPNVNLQAKERKIPPCDFYYDTFYSLPYSTFSKILPGIYAMPLL